MNNTDFWNVLDSDATIRQFLEYMEHNGVKSLWFSVVASLAPGLYPLFKWFQQLRNSIIFRDEINQKEEFAKIAVQIAGDKDEAFRRRLLRVLTHLSAAVGAKYCKHRVVIFRWSLQSVDF